MKKIVIYTLLGIVIFVFGFLAGSFWSTLKFLDFSPFEMGDAKEYPDFSYESSFWEHKYFGGIVGREDKLKTLPKGKGYLTGKFIYDGKPASGVKFTMHLNGKYKTGAIITDEDGKFTLRLKSGKWYINSISCENWKDKPKGNFVLISGDEEKLEGSLRAIFYNFQLKGKEVIVSDENPAKEHLTLTLNRRMKIEWPSEEPKQEATIARSMIRWTPYPEAKDYVIRIDRVTRESPRRTSYSPIIYERVTGENSLPLSKLKYINDPAAKKEYAVSIHAYGENGEFLSASEHLSGTFVLSDGNVLVEDEREYFGEIDEEAKELLENEKLIHAVEILIREKMFDEAESILKQVSEDDVDKLKGYMFAAKGDCEKAQEHFNIAKEKKGDGCIPEEYKVGCE